MRKIIENLKQDTMIREYYFVHLKYLYELDGTNIFCNKNKDKVTLPIKYFKFNFNPNHCYVLRYVSKINQIIVIYNTTTHHLLYNYEDLDLI